MIHRPPAPAARRAPQASRRFDPRLLDPRDRARLRALDSPARIRAFVTEELACNHEAGGDTCLSVRAVLREGHAHCIEAAFVAACALWMQGEPPLLLDLCAEGHDYDHVVALYRRRGLWGAISKSNRPWYRSRDPVYRSLRELAMSWFHEYCDGDGRKTLRSYGQPLDLSRIDPGLWITRETDCWPIVRLLDRQRHWPLLPSGQRRHVLPRDRFERSLNDHQEYPEPGGL
jgi:hypothetical protein